MVILNGKTVARFSVRCGDYHFVAYFDYDMEKNKHCITKVEPVTSGKWYEGMLISVEAKDELEAFTKAQRILEERFNG